MKEMEVLFRAVKVETRLESGAPYFGRKTFPSSTNFFRVPDVRDGPARLGVLELTVGAV